MTSIPLHYHGRICARDHVDAEEYQLARPPGRGSRRAAELRTGDPAVPGSPRKDATGSPPDDRGIVQEAVRIAKQARRARNHRCVLLQNTPTMGTAALIDRAGRLDIDNDATLPASNSRQPCEAGAT